MTKAVPGWWMSLLFSPFCLSLSNCSKCNWKYFYLKAIWQRGRKHIYSFKACVFSGRSLPIKFVLLSLGTYLGGTTWKILEGSYNPQPTCCSPPSLNSSRLEWGGGLESDLTSVCSVPSFPEWGRHLHGLAKIWTCFHLRIWRQE